MNQARIDSGARRQRKRIIPGLMVGGINYLPYEQMNDMRAEGCEEWQRRVVGELYRQRHLSEQEKEDVR